jgi:hypothetical protein
MRRRSRDRKAKNIGVQCRRVHEPWVGCKEWAKEEAHGALQMRAHQTHAAVCARWCVRVCPGGVCARSPLRACVRARICSRSYVRKLILLGLAGSVAQGEKDLAVERRESPRGRRRTEEGDDPDVEKPAASSQKAKSGRSSGGWAETSPTVKDYRQVDQLLNASMYMQSRYRCMGEST